MKRRAKGREWLEFLSPEPEAPEGLLEKILAHTGPGTTRLSGLPMPAAAGSATVPAFVPPVWQQPGFFARMRSCAAAAAADDGGDGVLLDRADAEPDRRAVDDACGWPTCGRRRCGRTWNGN